MKSLVDSPLRKGVKFIKSKLRTRGHSLFDLYATLRQKEYKADDMSFILDFVKKRTKEKKLVVLMDDIDFLSQKNLKFLRLLLFNHFRLQIIVAGTPGGFEKSNVKNFGEKDKLGIKLKPLEFEEFKDLIAQRIIYYGGKSIYPFSDEKLRRLYEKGNKNIKRVLNLCADTAIKMALRQKKSMAAKQVAENMEKGELEAFEKSADINKILASGKIEKEEEYHINVIEREPAPYKIKEVGSSRTYKIKHRKKKR